MNDTPTDRSTRLYLDDLRPGRRFTSGSCQVTVQEIVNFASAFDPQPFHLDEEAAKGTIFNGLAASGWHTAAITMRLLVDGGLPIAGGLIGANVAIAWPLPTRPGDTLCVDTEIVEVTPSTTRPERGTVIAFVNTRNQRQEIVQKTKVALIVSKHPD